MFLLNIYRLNIEEYTVLAPLTNISRFIIGILTFRRDIEAKDNIENQYIERLIWLYKRLD